MVKHTQNQKKENYINKKLWLKIYFVLFMILFVLSAITLLVAKSSEKQNPLYEHITQYCYNKAEVWRDDLEVGARYDVLKSNYKDGQYECTLIKQESIVVEDIQ